MINILRTLRNKIKQQQEELDRIAMECRVLREMHDNYCGWTSAYKNAIWSLHKDGILTDEQHSLLFKKAKEYYDCWQTN